MFRHVQKQSAERGASPESSESENDLDARSDGQSGSDDDAGSASGAPSDASIPDYLPTAKEAATGPLYAAPDGRRHCLVCPDKAILNAEIERLHVSSKARRRFGPCERPRV